MRDFINFLNAKRDGDPGTTIRDAMSQLHSEGLRPMEEGVSWNRGSTGVFEDIEPSPSTKPITVKVKRQIVPVVRYEQDDDGEWKPVSERLVTRYAEKPIRVDRIQYAEAENAIERAFVRAQDAFDQRKARQSGPRSKSASGNFASVRNSVMRAEMGEDKADQLCELMERALGVDVAYNDPTNMIETICAEIQSDPVVKTDEWIAFFELMAEETVSPEAIVENMSENDAHELAIRMDIPDWHVQNYQTKIRARREGIEINEIDGEVTDDEQIDEFVKAEAEERRIEARGRARIQTRPILISDMVRKSRVAGQSSYTVPLWKIDKERFDGKREVEYFPGSFAEVKAHVSSIPSHCEKIRVCANKVVRVGERGYRDVLFCVVKDENNETVTVRQSCRGKRSTRAAFKVSCSCGYSSPHAPEMDFELSKRLPGISYTELWSYANENDDFGTPFRSWNPDETGGKFLTVGQVKYEALGCDGAAYTRKIEDLTSGCDCPKCGSSLRYVALGNMSKDGRWFPDRVVIRDVRDEKLVAETSADCTILKSNDKFVVGCYGENVDDTWVVLKPDWLSQNPKYISLLNDIRHAKDLRRNFGSKAIREEIAKVKNVRARRMLESALNAEIRRRLISEVEQSQFINGQFFEVIADITMDNFHARSLQLNKLLFQSGRTSPEKSFGFGFIRALRDEFRQEALEALGQNDDFEVAVDWMKRCNVQQLLTAERKLNRNEFKISWTSAQKFILRELVRDRKAQMRAKYAETDEINAIYDRLESGSASNEEAKEASALAYLLNDDKLRSLANSLLS